MTEDHITRLDEQLDTTDIDVSRVDERRLADIVAVLDRTGVPKTGPDGLELDVVQRVAVLAAWARRKMRR